MPGTTSTDLLSVQLLVQGKASNAMLTRITVDKSINRIAKANLVLQDGSKAKEDFKLSDSQDFLPGNEIEIKAGYHSKEQTIFKGIIMNQAISIDAEAGPSLIVDCKDKAVASTMNRKNAYFTESSDSDIIKKILSSYSFQNSVQQTSVKYEEVIQYGTTDWDFIVTRAEINGLLVITDDGELSVEKPAISEKPILDLTYGDDIIELNLSVGSDDQFTSVDSVSWDASQQKLVKGQSKEPTVNKEGNLQGQKLADVLNAKERLQSPTALDKEALNSWANAQLLKSRLARFQGTILCDGNASIKPNTLIELKGIGKRVNGSAFISAVRHELEEGRWLTECTVGLQKDWFVQEVPVNALKAGGRIPAMNGLQIGVVKKIHEDPAGEFRVQVSLPLIESSDEGIWARLSTYYASEGFGNFFYPEVGDEVILGFLDDDPSAPVILGSVYSKSRNPALVPDDKNTHKAIVTRSQMTINFDDEKKIITIETPAKNTITLSDEEKEIKLTDQNNNVVQLNTDGITINSSKDIVIKAANDIKISAINIEAKAQSNLDIKANNITEKANMSFAAQAGSSAELKAAGNVTVKGAMVSIN